MKYEIIANNIIQWLKDYAEKSKINGFVVGISGGIDSALTSSLCANTGLPTLCIDMPILQSEDEVKRASKHITWLQNKFDNVSHKSIDLNNVFLSFKSTVEEESDENNFLTLANSRSRIRMTTLYYFAGLHGFLVAGTGNKVEDFGVGFFTKYGDGGVDISPIADLIKSEVRLLAAYLQVPESILKAKPTDGLFGDDRSDEDQIGANYDELEWVMAQIENGKTIEDFSGREAQIFSIYKRLNTANQHKMNPIPVCKISKTM